MRQPFYRPFPNEMPSLTLSPNSILKTVNRRRNPSAAVDKGITSKPVYRHDGGIAQQPAEFHGLSHALADAALFFLKIVYSLDGKDMLEKVAH